MYYLDVDNDEFGLSVFQAKNGRYQGVYRSQIVVRSGQIVSGPGNVMALSPQKVSFGMVFPREVLLKITTDRFG